MASPQSHAPSLHSLHHGLGRCIHGTELGKPADGGVSSDHKQMGVKQVMKQPITGKKSTHVVACKQRRGMLLLRKAALLVVQGCERSAYQLHPSLVQGKQHACGV